MATYLWDDYGIRKTFSERSKWVESKQFIDPYGNALEYFFRVNARESKFSLLLCLTFNSALIVEISVISYEINTDEKVTNIINTFLQTDDYKIIVGAISPPIYELSDKLIPISAIDIPTIPDEIVGLMLSGDNTTDDTALIYQYTEELNEFLNKKGL